MILRLQRNHIDLLKQETLTVHPIEACAILFGELSIDEAVVKRVKVVTNRLQSTRLFEVDPAMVALAVAEAEKQCLEFVGLFHSHPAPAKPSSIDMKFMQLWGDIIWLIMSTTEDKMAAYFLLDGKLEEATISIE